GPDCIGGADRQDLERAAEQIDERREQRNGQRRPTGARVPVGIFDADRPCDVEQTRDDEQKPRERGRHAWPPSTSQDAMAVASVSAAAWAVATVSTAPRVGATVTVRISEMPMKRSHASTKGFCRSGRGLPLPGR